MTVGEFEAATPRQRETFMRQLLIEWKANYHRQCQRDAEADQRAFEIDLTDGESPIDRVTGIQSSTNRVAK